MFEWLTGFAVGIFSSWFFLIGVFFFAILAETKESLGWSIFLGILTIVSLYFVFGLTALTGLSWWMLALIYGAGGIVHSLWRWFRSTSIATEKFNEYVGDVEDVSKLSDRRVRDYKEATDYRDNLDKITYWIVAWPISGAAHFLGDVVNVIQKSVQKFFSGVFDSITERARGKAKIDVSNFE